MPKNKKNNINGKDKMEQNINNSQDQNPKNNKPTDNINPDTLETPEELQADDNKDSNTPATEPTAEDIIVSKDEEISKLKTSYLYLKAEFDNFRKQSIKDRSQMVKFGHERFVRDLAFVLDIFDQAISTKPTIETINNYVEGIELTAKEMTKVLETHGVKEIKSTGSAFNPEFHEALNQVPTDEVEEGHIYQVLRKGYTINDKVLRPSQVIVASKPS